MVHAFEVERVQALRFIRKVSSSSVICSSECCFFAFPLIVSKKLSVCHLLSRFLQQSVNDMHSHLQQVLDLFILLLGDCRWPSVVSDVDGCLSGVRWQ